MKSMFIQNPWRKHIQQTTKNHIHRKLKEQKELFAISKLPDSLLFSFKAMKNAEIRKEPNAPTTHLQTSEMMYIQALFKTLISFWADRDLHNINIKSFSTSHENSRKRQIGLKILDSSYNCTHKHILCTILQLKPYDALNHTTTIIQVAFSYNTYHSEIQ